MKTSKLTWLGRIIFPSIFLIYLLSGCAVIGTYEPVVIHHDNIDWEINAKIDSGAKRSSIGTELVNEIGLTPLSETVTVKSASGISERKLVEIEFTLAGKTIKTTANIADRRHLEYSFIVGVMDLENRFLIKPETSPEEEEAEED